MNCGTSESVAADLLLRNGTMKFDDLDKKMRVFETAADYVCAARSLHGGSAGWPQLHSTHERGM